jgi:hypothetical protein
MYRFQKKKEGTGLVKQNLTAEVLQFLFAVRHCEYVNTTRYHYTINLKDITLILNEDFTYIYSSGILIVAYNE